MTDPSERLDLACLGQGLAGAVEDGEFERADAWVEAYFTAAAGGWAMFQRSDGGCYALTRAVPSAVTRVPKACTSAISTTR